MAAESFNLPGTAARVTTRQPLGAVVPRSRGAVIANWLSSTDHKVIGNLYFITSYNIPKIIIFEKPKTQ